MSANSTCSWTSYGGTLPSLRMVFIRIQIVYKDVTITFNIYAEEFEEANTASVETISSCISIPSVTKTTEE